jgi:hypothetical protein
MRTNQRGQRRGGGGRSTQTIQASKAGLVLTELSMDLKIKMATG